MGQLHSGICGKSVFLCFVLHHAAPCPCRSYLPECHKLYMVSLSPGQCFGHVLVDPVTDLTTRVLVADVDCSVKASQLSHLFPLGPPHPWQTCPPTNPF